MVLYILAVRKVAYSSPIRAALEAMIQYWLLKICESRMCFVIWEFLDEAEGQGGQG